MKSKAELIRLVLVIILLFSMVPFACVEAQSKSTRDSVVFNYKPEAQPWVVPEGVSVIHIDAYGAQGGSPQGGKGGRVQSDLKVTPGMKFIIHVGSHPNGAEAGYNGGGKGCGKGYGGGGASDLRVGGDALENRILVAGGGGGGNGYFGGTGTGLGGGVIGGEGKSMYDEAHIAIGGTQEAGGRGARAYYSPSGTAGVGGDGISSRGQCTNDMMNGGGGGYFGGGGGGAGYGGGGSSYTSVANINVIHQQGVNEGDGKIKIYWDKPSK